MTDIVLSFSVKAPPEAQDFISKKAEEAIERAVSEWRSKAKAIAVMSDQTAWNKEFGGFPIVRASTYGVLPGTPRHKIPIDFCIVPGFEGDDLPVWMRGSRVGAKRSHKENIINRYFRVIRYTEVDTDKIEMFLCDVMHRLNVYPRSRPWDAVERIILGRFLWKAIFINGKRYEIEDTATRKAIARHYKLVKKIERKRAVASEDISRVDNEQ